MTDQQKVADDVKDELWKRIGPLLVNPASLVISSRVSAAQKTKDLAALLKAAYVSGLDRGYDMGYHVFGDGE